MVEPIMISLFQYPTKEQLLEISEQVNAIYEREDFQTLEKILEILHLHEK